MSIEERKTREKERLKRKILDAAFAIVNREGHEALTIRKLADRIEYSPRTIYLYYEDKEALLRAIIEHGFAFTVKNLEANDYYRGLSAEEHLKSIISNHIRTAAGNINYYNSVIHVIQKAGFEPGPNQMKFEHYLNESIGCYLKESPAGSGLTLFFLFSSIRGITVELINKRLPADEEELNRIIEDVFDFYKKLLRS